MISQTITLRSQHHYGRRIPFEAFDKLPTTLCHAVRQSVRMAIEGRSQARGKHPDWLKAAADIRFLGHDGDDETVLHFEAPTLGEAAPRIYEQISHRSTRPDPNQTGFDVLSHVLLDIAAKNIDSELFDRPLLESITKFDKILNGTFTEIAIGSGKCQSGESAAVTSVVVEAAKNLYQNTPIPQRVRIVGKLDALRASTQSFGVILDDGQEIRGVLAESDIAGIRDYLNQRVLVLGMAIYRPSGKLLRIDAEEVSASVEDGSFFSVIPTPQRRKFDLRDTIRSQHQNPGISAIIGNWPGSESDEQIEAALKELS